MYFKKTENNSPESVLSFLQVDSRGWTLTSINGSKPLCMLSCFVLKAIVCYGCSCPCPCGLRNPMFYWVLLVWHTLLLRAWCENSYIPGDGVLCEVSMSPQMTRGPSGNWSVLLVTCLVALGCSGDPLCISTFCLCVCVCICLLPHAQERLWRPERAVGPLKLELQVPVSCPMWVLGNCSQDLRQSSRLS